MPFAKPMLAVPALLVAAAVAAQEPVSTARMDDQGVFWSYEAGITRPSEPGYLRLSATIEAPGPSQDAIIQLSCAAGTGRQVRLILPGWRFVVGAPHRLEARLDLEEPFEVVAVGELGMDGAAIVDPERGSAELIRGLLFARERIVLRGPDGPEIAFPMGTERPEADEAMQRCEALLSGR
ncbi:hypothetical protein [Muricoccus radiodurans]|uniref:hypothetical protein n=1 Tax=Muricoccus radiodurans TaxID=2231721 RepID=UPI003CE8DDEC